MAWRQLRRDLRAGEVRILFAAVVLAVLAISAVGFVTERAERALAREANRLLGGDVVLRADAPIEGALREAAQRPGLQSAETRELQSMVRVEGREGALRLGELRALGEGFPLRGAFQLQERATGPARSHPGIPARGTVWLGRAGAETLGAQVGDTLVLGDLPLRLTALVAQEPDASLDLFDFAPKVFLNLQDLQATGLVQEGSRIRYRLVVAGEAPAVARVPVSSPTTAIRNTWPI